MSERRGTTTTFSHSGLKNADVQSSVSQAVNATQQYDAFGNLASSTGTWQGQFGYGGGFGYQQDATGLKLLGHRYYDSSTGRFLTRDSIKDGRNWYVYCAGDPVGRVDYDGARWRRVVGAILGGLAGAVLSGGNPLGAAAGAAIGGAIGSAADQFDETESVDLGQAIRDGLTDGVLSYGIGKLMTLAVARLVPLTSLGNGMVKGIHYTNPEAAKSIAESGFRPGLVYAWPRQVPKAVNWLVGSGSKTGGTVIIEVAESRVKRNMFGAMMVRF